MGWLALHEVGIDKPQVCLIELAAETEFAFRAYAY